MFSTIFFQLWRFLTIAWKYCFAAFGFAHMISLKQTFRVLLHLDLETEGGFHELCGFRRAQGARGD